MLRRESAYAGRSRGASVQFAARGAAAADRAASDSEETPHQAVNRLPLTPVFGPSSSETHQLTAEEGVLASFIASSVRAMVERAPDRRTAAAQRRLAAAASRDEEQPDTPIDASPACSLDSL